MHSSAPGHGCPPAVQQLGLTDGDTWKKPLPLAAVSPPAPVQPGCACSMRPDMCAPTRQTQDTCEHTSVSLCTQPGLRHWTGGCFIQRRETETHGTSARGAHSSAPAPLVLSWAALPCRQKGPQRTAAGSLHPSQTDGDSHGGQDGADKPLAPLRSALLPNPEPYGNDPSGEKNHRAR